MGANVSVREGIKDREKGVDEEGEELSDADYGDEKKKKECDCWNAQTIESFMDLTRAEYYRPLA